MGVMAMQVYFAVLRSSEHERITISCSLESYPEHFSLCILSQGNSIIKVKEN